MAQLTGGFEGGNCTNIKYLGDNTFSCSPEVDHATMEKGCTNQWFMWKARVENAAFEKITILLQWPEFDRSKLDPSYEFGMTESFIEVAGDAVYFSYDELQWERIRNVEVNGSEIKIAVYPIENTIYLSVNLPYTVKALKSLYTCMSQKPCCSVDLIGKSYEGRDIRVITITENAVSKEKKKTIYIQAGQHPSEMSGPIAADAAARFLASDKPLAQRLRKKYIFHIVPFVTIDGLYCGSQQHPSGINLNRDWKDFTQPESRAVRDFLSSAAGKGENLALAVDLHNGWVNRTDNGSCITILPAEVTGEEYVNRQLEFIRRISENCDYISPGSIWDHGFTDRWFEGFSYLQYRCLSFVFEFSRFNIYNRGGQKYVPLTQEGLMDFSIDFLKVVEDSENLIWD